MRAPSLLVLLLTSSLTSCECFNAKLLGGWRPSARCNDEFSSAVAPLSSSKKALQDQDLNDFSAGLGAVNVNGTRSWPSASLSLPPLLASKSTSDYDAAMLEGYWKQVEQGVTYMGDEDRNKVRDAVWVGYQAHRSVASATVLYIYLQCISLTRQANVAQTPHHQGPNKEVRRSLHHPSCECRPAAVLLDDICVGGRRRLAARHRRGHGQG